MTKDQEKLINAALANETMIMVRCGEWWSDYRCWKCGKETTVADDSDAARLPNKGHECAAHPVRNHLVN